MNILFTRLRASNPRRVAGDTALSQASSFHFLFPLRAEKPSSTLGHHRQARPSVSSAEFSLRFSSSVRVRPPLLRRSLLRYRYKFSGALAFSSVFQTVVIRGGVTQQSPRFHRDDLATAGVVGLFEARRLRPPPSPAPLSAASESGSASGAFYLYNSHFQRIELQNFLMFLCL